MRGRLIPRLVLLTVAAWASSAVAQPVVPECKGAVEPSVKNGCAGVADAGCCDIQGRALWCDGGDLYCLDCNDGFPACGWNTYGYYGCGQTAGSQDPSGQHPISCAPCAGCAPDAPCSATCPGSCGQCPGKTAVCLESGSCYEPQCAGKECGTDPMGFACGSCPDGTVCVDGIQQCYQLPAGCHPKEGPGCDGCGCESCVCAKYPTCCTDNWDLFCAAACEKECGADCSGCPPDPSCGVVECGKYCGIDCGKCPQGQLCHEYACCAPSCVDKECGTDGCGGSCGTCSGTDECSAIGQCVSCAPKCKGKACGDDGCGGSCGSCKGDTVCSSGACVSGLCASLCGSGYPEGCGNKCECYCDNQCFEYGDCCEAVCESCPDFGDCCTPSCGDQQCGPDGCGGSCGQCGKLQDCIKGQCVDKCKPQCDGKVCGDDGCGGLCGPCELPALCAEGQCIQCEVDCTGRVCGNDGCGGSCGDCATDEICTPQGACQFKCLEQCLDRECGPAAAGCDASCGDCPEGEICNATGLCIGQCMPVCTGRACGADGCGGSCGVCGRSELCTTGECRKQMGCGDVGDSGLCQGTVLTWCETGVLASMDCASVGKVCAKKGIWHGCVNATACTPDCAGRACGGDDCGSHCGVCEPGLSCVDHQCKEPPPDEGPAEADTAHVAEPAPPVAGNDPGDDGCSVGRSDSGNRPGTVVFLLAVLLCGAACLRKGAPRVGRKAKIQ